MIYAILGIILGLSAWIYKQYKNLEALKRQLFETKAGDEIADLAKQIDASQGKVKEEIQDYEDAKKAFDAKYGSDSGGSSSGS